MSLQRWKDGRAWAVYDEQGDLVVVTLYKRGAEEVMRRLFSRRHEETPPPGSQDQAGGNSPPSLCGVRRRPQQGFRRSVPVP